MFLQPYQLPMSLSTLLHLRIPFSFFLLPIYLFALALSDNILWPEVVLVFIILHLFLYPASNGYNSYFDKDKDSIGGLRTPSKVTDDLYYVSLILDAMALGLGAFIGWDFVLMLLVYGLVSKAYSHPRLRLKKYPILGWFIAGFFQGFFTWIMSYKAINQVGWQEILQPQPLLAAGLCTLLLWGSFPMTQIYQHKEDGPRGDQTISILLGIRGTFYFSAAMFGLANASFLYFFWSYYEKNVVWVFQLFLLPIFGYFLWWLIRVLKDVNQANFDHTMRLNIISSFFLNCFFLGFHLVRP